MIQIPRVRTFAGGRDGLERPLKIAMVAPPFYEVPPAGYGGLEAICANLVDALVDRGHEVTLFGAGERSGTRARFVSTTPRLQYPRLGEVIPGVLHAARVAKLLDRHDFDVVHDHTVPGPLTAARRRYPTVVTVHSAVDDELGDYYAALGGTVRLVAISDSQRGSRPDLPWVATVHNAVNDPVGPVSDARLGPVMWLARFHPDKGPDLAVTASRQAGLPLVLAGKANESTERWYLDNVLTPMLGEDVELIVNGDRSEITRKLRAARCLVLPLRWREPFGMVMIEAMSFGVPVVALRRGSVPEIVVDGVTGFICDTPEELPDALRRVGQLDRAACVEHVRRHFTADVMAARYEEVYQQAIAHVLAVTLGQRTRLGRAVSTAAVS